MQKTYRSQLSFRYKLAYDGRDLISKPLGQAVIGSYGKNYIQSHCTLEISSELVESFIQTCVQERKLSKGLDFRNLSTRLCDKYEVGLFMVSYQNCIAGVDYVLFNQEQLTFWQEAGVDILGAQFLVVPSRDWNGNINEIGFRILDPQLVHQGFKWLFPVGQQATFGLHTCDPAKRLVLCEGFLDYVALVESNHSNIVGLGSVELTANHLSQIKSNNWLTCFDMDNFGLLKSAELIDQGRACFYSPEGKDPYEVYLKYGKVDLIYLS